MRHRISRALAGCMVAAAMLASTAVHADLVTNGGFETGDFTGWTQFGDQTFTAVDVLSPHSGTYAAYFGPANTGGISQLLATTAGTYYDVSFWLMNEADVLGNSGPNSFEFSWDGVVQTTLTNAPAFGYTQYSYVLQATGSSTQLKLNYQQIPAVWDLDDVSAAVPEPGSLALAGLAVALVAMQGRRRRHPALAA